MQRTIRPLGDSALRIAFEPVVAPAINAEVRRIGAALERCPPPGMREVVPAYAALTVYYAPDATTYDALAAAIAALADAPDAPPPAALVEMPVCYGGPYGPDLGFVAAFHGLSEAEVIARHSAPTYPIYMLGFAPGFPYLGGLDERLATPRRATPRMRVPAGSVGIAGAQTGVYPLETPGGWQLIGRTPWRLFHPAHEPPSRLEAGQRLRFVPIDAATYERLAAEETP